MAEHLRTQAGPWIGARFRTAPRVGDAAGRPTAFRAAAAWLGADGAFDPLDVTTAPLLHALVQLD